MTIPVFNAGQILTASELNDAVSAVPNTANIFTEPQVFAKANTYKGPQTFEDLINQPPGVGANNQTPFAQYGDFLSDFIVEGLSVPVPSPASLTATLSTGTAVVLGQRTVVDSIPNATNAYAASSDTYVSLSQSGVVAYTAVANGATAPAPASDAVNILKVVTGPMVSPTPTLSAGTSGTLAAGTYQVALVAYDATGYGAVSASESVTVAASGSIGISWTNPLNETSMSIYVTDEGGTTLGLVESGVTGTSYTYTGSVAPGAAAPSGATSNAVQAVIPVNTSLETKLKQLGNVLSFGADPTGRTDSTDAFAAAGSASSSPFVPKGTYLLNSTPAPDQTVVWRLENGVILLGEGELPAFTIQVGPMSSWVSSIQSGDYAYLESNAETNIRTAPSSIGSFSAVRTSSGQGLSGQANICYAALAYNDLSGGSADTWLYYGTSARLPNALGYTHGIELDSANLGETVPIYPGQIVVSGMTDCLWLAAGGELTSNNTVGTASCAIAILSNDPSYHANFEKGIVFSNTSIYGCTGDSGNGVAIAFASGHTMKWYNNSNQQVTEIVSNTYNQNNATYMEFSDEGIFFGMIPTASTPNVQIPNVTNLVNGLQFFGSATGVEESIQAYGSDTNIDIAILPKGSGSVWIGPYTAGAVTASGYITVKDTSGNIHNLLCT